MPLIVPAVLMILNTVAEHFPPMSVQVPQVVGWLQSLRTPLLIMAAIPFSLVGILPAHALMGAFFTATSMIGFIAGAGIVVRNSIILVDFIELRRREGRPLRDAVIEAGAVRFRPMLLTALAVIALSLIISPVWLTFVRGYSHRVFTETNEQAA